jgi:hypothetical protein
MAVIGRQLLKRYPGLRGSWAVRQAAAWRQRRGWRAHPRRMASWYCDTPELSTRLIVSNLELPEASAASEARSVLLTLRDSDGVELGSRRLQLERNATAIVELGEILPDDRRGNVQSGQVVADFEGPQLGSSRAYLHWYNERSLTSSHEKFGLTLPAVGGYWTVPNIQDDDEYRVHLAVVNLDIQPYVSDVILKDEAGHELRAQAWLPANGSRFVALNELFQEPHAFLNERPGVLYFGNNRQAAMYYYFVHNQRLGTWRVQHL